MKRKNWFFIFAFTLLIALGLWGLQIYRNDIYLSPPFNQLNRLVHQSPIIAIQSFEGIDSSAVNEVRKAIEQYYELEVKVLEPIPLPQEYQTSRIPAFKYYNPSPYRYRADSLLKYLKRIKPKECKYILGLTASDISTTKRRNGQVKAPAWMYTDWGIFGLGYRPGPSCMVSTYRLGRDTYDQQKINQRLRKIVNHELGHNFGLPHCKEEQCFMRDARETILTIDAAPERLCPACKKKIENKR